MNRSITPSQLPITQSVTEETLYQLTIASFLENYFIKLPNVKDKYCVKGQFNGARSYHDFLLGEG